MTFMRITTCVSTSLYITRLLRDAIHTHFFKLIGKWTIVGGWVKHWTDKVAKLKYKSFVKGMNGVPIEPSLDTDCVTDKYTS